MIAGTLSIEMEANVARFAQDMAQVKNIVGSGMKNVESAVASAKSALGALGIGLGAGYFVSLIRASIDVMDHMRDLSKTTDILIEDLGGLQLLAKQSGGDLDSMAQAINKLSQNMGSAAEKFRALGVSAKDPVEAFKQLSDIFVALKDPQQRAAVMAEALGKSWAGAAPALSEGSKRIGEIIERAKQLNGPMKDAADKSDEFNDRLAELNTTLGAGTRSVVDYFLPAMNAIAKDMQLAAEKGAGLLAVLVGIGSALLRIAGIRDTDEVATRVKAINDQLAIAQKQLQSGTLGGNNAGKHFFSFLVPETLLGEKALASIRKTIDALEREKARLAPTTPRVSLEDLDTSAAASALAAKRAAGFIAEEKEKKAVAETESAYKSMLKTLSEMLLQEHERTEVTKLQMTLDAMIAKKLEEFKPGQVDHLKRVAAEVDLMKQEKAATENYIKVLDSVREQQKQWRDDWAAYTKVQEDALKAGNATADQIEFETTLIGKENAARELAIALRQIETSEITKEGTAREDLAKKITEALANRQAAQAADDLRKREREEWGSLWSTVEQTGKSVFVAVFSSGKTAFEGIGRALKASVIDLLYQLTAKKWILQIGTSLAGSLGIQTASAANSASGIGSALNIASMGSKVGGWLSGATGFGEAMAGSALTASSTGTAFGLSAELAAGAMGSTAAAAGASTGIMAGLASIGPVGWAAIAAGALLGGAALFGKKRGPKGSDAFLRDRGNGQFGVEMNNVAGGDPDIAMIMALNAALNDRSKFDPAKLAGLLGTGVGNGTPADTAALINMLTQALGPAAESAKALAEAVKQVEEADLAAAEAARALAVERRGFEIRLMEATGDAIGALAAKREDEKAAANEANRALLDQIYAAEDLAVASKAAADAAAEQARIEQEAAAQTLARVREVATERYGLETRLLQALGNTAALRERELAGTNDLNRELLRQIYAAEDLAAATVAATKATEASAVAQKQLAQEREAAVTSAADALRQAYQRESSDLVAMIGKWEAAGASLRAYSATLTGLGGGGASYGAAFSAFGATAAGARLGDLTAIGNLQAVSETFRTASMAASATQTDYLRDIGRIQAAIADTVGVTDRQGSVAQERLDGAREQVSALININEGVRSLREEMANFRAEVAAARASDKTGSNTAAIESLLRRFSPDGASIRVELAA